VVEILIAEKGSLVTSEVAVAEADYLILTRLGIEVELAFLDDLAEGTFLVECLTREELGVARDLACRHRDLELGLADVSLMVLAGRYHTRRIVTFDERAFRTNAPARWKLHRAPCRHRLEAPRRRRCGRWRSSASSNRPGVAPTRGRPATTAWTAASTPA
jgi:predicted nucleic acid-binding protein